MTSFSLNHLFKDPISKCSHLLGSWGLGSEHRVLGVPQLIPDGAAPRASLPPVLFSNGRTSTWGPESPHIMSQKFPFVRSPGSGVSKSSWCPPEACHPRTVCGH